MATVGDILRMTMSIDMPAAVVAQLVFHWKVATGSETDYAAIGLALETRLQTAFDDITANIAAAVTGSEVSLAEWDFVDNEWDGKDTQATTGYTGLEAVTEMLPHGDALLMRFITEELRRQGRKFLPGLTEAGSEAGSWSSGVITNALLAAGTLNNVVTAGGLTADPCTFNDTPLSARFETASLFTPTALVNTFVSYQRRRRPGVGI